MSADGVIGDGRVAATPAAVSDDPVRARRRLPRLLEWRSRPRGHVTLHHGAGVEGPGEAIGYQRAMFAVRALGVAILVAVTPLYATVDPVLLLGAIAILLAVLAFQVAWLRDDHAIASWRRLALLGVLADGLALVLISQAFLRNGSWVGYLPYPLVALEGAVFFGMAGALAAAAVTTAAFLVQALERWSLGLETAIELPITVAAVLMLQAFFVGLYAHVNRRVRGDLATLLRLSALLAQQESPTRVVQALDGWLTKLLGARVRGVALRRPDGGYDVLRWRDAETRNIPPALVAAIVGLTGRDLEQDFRDRHAVTIAIEPDRDGLLIAGLGLPRWVRSLTLVPIHSDGVHSGILPVLWDTRRAPNDGELDLLHGLADQTGQAFAQAQLQRARELAATDSLTGLANHRAFQDLLERHLADARGRGARLAILFCDLDRFKTVNDRHGHAVGDLLLHRIATAVRSVARSGDVVARYGGDELALILPDAGAEAAVEVGHRLLDEVRAVDNGLGVDVTVGVAVYPDDAESQVSLLAQADAAMYAGKRLGGGRVVHAATIPVEA